MKSIFNYFTATALVIATSFGCTKTNVNSTTASTSSERVATSGAIANNTMAGCGYHCTYTQGGYGAPNGRPHDFMYANFRKAFPKGFPVGSKDCPDGHVVVMKSPQAVTNTLPVGGTPAALTQDYVNSSPKNVLVGQLVTLCLNLGLEPYDPNFTNTTTPLKNMIIAKGTFAGWTVSAFFTEANLVLGGCSTKYSPSQVNEAASAINENYDMGSKSTDNGFLTCP